jgi:hypothetical protein
MADLEFDRDVFTSRPVGSLYEREAEGVVPFSIERKKRTVSRYDQTSSS